MSEFRIAPKPLNANPAFMDIHKDKHSHKHTEKEQISDAFDAFKSYKKNIEMLFSDLPKEHQFWIVDGTPLHNLHELYAALDRMADETFEHHVTGDKNDFASWVSNVYHDEELAYKLHRARHKTQAKRAIEDRIEELINVGEEHTKEDSFFQALIKKLSKQNKKLEAELTAKKQWILKKEKELEAWESKNIEHERHLHDKYKALEHEEQSIYAKFKRLQTQEDELNHALQEEKKQIEEQNRKLAQEKQKFEHEHQHLEQEKQAVEHEKDALSRRKIEIREHREIRVKQALSEKHKHIYQRIDELLSYATASVMNKNYTEARDTMSRVKYYYNSLPNEDPYKKDVYKKIINLRKHLSELM